MHGNFGLMNFLETSNSKDDRLEISGQKTHFAATYPLFVQNQLNFKFFLVKAMPCYRLYNGTSTTETYQ